MVQYTGLSADEVWRDIVNDLLESPAHTTNSRVGKTFEFLQCTLLINDPRRRWIFSRCPAYNPAYGLVELIWILNGSEDSALLKFWNPQLPKFSGSEDKLHGSYGHRLRKNFKLDQIYRAYLSLKSSPESRQVVLQIWDPTKDFPDRSGKPVSSDIPCNIVAFLKLRNNRLYWTQVMRSNDAFRGLPYNLIQFTVLHELFTSWLKCDMGTYLHLSDSLHLYKSDIEKFHIGKKIPLMTGIGRKPINLSYKDTMSQLGTIYDDLKTIAALNSNCERDMLRELLTNTFHPNNKKNQNRADFFNDAMCVIGSDAARRLGDKEFAYEVLAQCKEKELRLAAEKWLNRYLT